MKFILKGYKGKCRLAKVTRNPINTESFEQLILAQDNSFFTSDNYLLPKEQPLRLKQLQIGDIVWINEFGIGTQLFSSLENDATIYITGHCNSNCLMCPMSDEERRAEDSFSDELQLDYIKMLPANLQHIVVTGGEPTLRIKLFFKSLEIVKHRFPDIEILLLTNGRSFSISQFADRLAGLAIKNMLVAIPLHGPKDSLHDAITNVPGSFRQTVAGIQNLLERNVSIEIRIVVSKLNYQYLNDIALLIVQKFPKVKIVNFVGLETRGNCAVNFSQVYLDQEESFHAMKPSIDYLLYNGIDVGIYNFPLCKVARGYWQLCKKSISREKVCFSPLCHTCTVQSACGGFFNTTLSMTKPRIKPILMRF